MITIATNFTPSAQSVKVIRITGCRDKLLWYSNRIGDLLPLVREDSSGYWAREPAGYLNIIRKDDAELIQE